MVGRPLMWVSRWAWDKCDRWCGRLSSPGHLINREGGGGGGGVEAHVCDSGGKSPNVGMQQWWEACDNGGVTVVGIPLVWACFQGQSFTPG